MTLLAIAGRIAAGLTLLLAGCGGGGFDPFWVSTRVAAADLDGDGLVEVITLSTWIESHERRTGHRKVSRQRAPGVFDAVPAQRAVQLRRAGAVALSSRRASTTSCAIAARSASSVS